MSAKRTTIARILLFILIIIGIGFGIKIGIASAKELTHVEHLNARAHLPSAFHLHEPAAVWRAHLHRKHDTGLVDHNLQAVHFDVHHSMEVHAA